MERQERIALQDSRDIHKARAIALRNEWIRKVANKLKGRTIVGVDYLSEEEQKSMGWSCSPVILTLDNGQSIYPICDAEGNDGGSLGYDGTPPSVFPAI